MEPEKFEQLKKDVNYLNEEVMHVNGKQLMLFENADAAIAALRANAIPGVEWTDEDEEKFQRDYQLEKLFEDS